MVHRVRQSCYPGAKESASCRSLWVHLSILMRAKSMSIPNETLQAMIRSYHGFALSDDELELVRPELESYLAEVEKLRDLDLANVMSGRLLRAQEGEAI